MSGLSAACHLTQRKKKITVFESTSHAGGRCRSYYDRSLELKIDNGNHLILSANKNFLNFCKLINSSDSINIYKPTFNFYDMNDKSNWSIELNKGMIPWWILNSKKRVPNTNFFDYLKIFKFKFCKPSDTVADLVGGQKKLYLNFWEPLTLGVLNTPCNTASAKLLWNVLKETFLKGSEFCKICQPKNNWNETLINPATEFLEKNGVSINFNSLVKGFDISNNYIKKIYFANNEINISNDDMIITSIPPNGLSKLLPMHALPNEFNTIVNIHFKIKSHDIKSLDPPILGVINSLTHWIFIKKEYISITISSANKLLNLNSEQLANRVWAEVRQALSLSEEKIPEFKILKEKTATYEQSPKNTNLVKNLSNLPKNLILSGDWTQKNFPSTIESSILSGKKSIEKLLNH